MKRKISIEAFNAHDKKDRFQTISRTKQQYNVVQLGASCGGKFGGLGQRASWAVHGSVHGWCLGDVVLGGL